MNFLLLYFVLFTKSRKSMSEFQLKYRVLVRQHQNDFNQKYVFGLFTNFILNTSQT